MAQLLAGPPAADPLEAVGRLLAVQAQDPRGARLAVRARAAAGTAADVDHAVGAGRALVVTWLNRGTLHLVRSEDLDWLHRLVAPRTEPAVLRRLAQEGVDAGLAERGVRAITAALDGEGPLTRHRLAERVAAAGVPTAGQAIVHLLALTSLRGLIVRGPLHGRVQAFVLIRDWLPPSARLDRDRALALLARRYLAGHGPATDADLARWSGLPLRDARAGLRAIAGEIEHRDADHVALRGRAGSLPAPPPRLLGAFEPVLLGWSTRDWVLPPEAARLAVSGGVFRPFALVNGTAAGVWRLERGRVAVSPFAALAPAHAAALDADAHAVLAFLGDRWR